MSDENERIDGDGGCDLADKVAVLMTLDVIEKGDCDETFARLSGAILAHFEIDMYRRFPKLAAAARGGRHAEIADAMVAFYQGFARVVEARGLELPEDARQVLHFEEREFARRAQVIVDRVRGDA